MNSGSPPSCGATFWQRSVASPSEMGNWLASKVSRYLSILCLWYRRIIQVSMRTADSTAVSLSVANGTSFVQKKLGFWARVGGVTGRLSDRVKFLPRDAMHPRY